MVVGLIAAGALLVWAPAAMAEFGVQSFSVAALHQNGTADVQAGSHPYEFVTAFTLNPPRTEGGLLTADGNVKDVEVELPPGFAGDPNATPKCEYASFAERKCPDDTVVGIAHLALASGSVTFKPSVPVYNMEPSPGHPAEFGFRVASVLTVFMDVSVRTGGDYGLTVTVRNIAQAESTIAADVSFWGVPGAASHDALRGKCLKENDGTSQGDCPVSVPVLPLLMNPTSCGVPRSAVIRVDSWQEPGLFKSLSTSMPELSGCEKLDFSPTISVTPDGTEGSTPTGLNVNVHVPQESTQNPLGLAEADVMDTTVTLPAGVQLSPSAADGLQACSNAQIGFTGVNPQSGADEFTPEKPSCPDASKVATVKIKTPLLEEELEGEVYLAAPQNFAGLPENPFSSLVALYLVAEDPVAGVLVKLPGKVTPDPVTGQLTSTFENTPQLPFSDLKLEFYGTARAPLATPSLCGTYTTTTSFAPWSGGEPKSPSSSFPITSGPNGAPCSNPLPFAPSLASGMTNINGGSFSPLTTTLSREDGQQSISSVQLHYPPGLTGLLSGVRLCGEAEANGGACGPDSEIGETTVSVGLGNDPFTVTGGKVYLTGPYRGAPFGLSIVNPAKAGPFDLQEGRPVVVRAKVEVDPSTAALTITTDPSGAYAIPTIIEGIPLQIKHVNVNVARPSFTINPTNCNPMSITGRIASAEGASSPVSVPFQVTNCAILKFTPKFAVSTSGKTSKANGASLTSKLSYPPGSQGKQANIAKVKVELPVQLPSRLTTLQKACLAARFNANPASCPSASVVGHAKVLTPLLPVPLEGPAYFVSHGGEAFPDLTIVLQGYGVTIYLVGTTFINKAGITSTTFKTAPDTPFESFELTLPQGKFSALGANGNLCDLTRVVTVKKRVTVHSHGHTTHVLRKLKRRISTSLAMPTEFVAQNGLQIHRSTPIHVTGCPKAKPKAKAKRKASGTRRHHGKRK
jgi:hypothetical protein